MFVKFNIGFKGWGMLPFSHHQSPEFGTMTDCHAKVTWMIGVGWKQLYCYGSIPKGLFIVRDVRGGLDPQMYPPDMPTWHMIIILDVIWNVSEVTLWISKLMGDGILPDRFKTINTYKHHYDDINHPLRADAVSQHFPARADVHRYDWLPMIVATSAFAKHQALALETRRHAHGKWHYVATPNVVGSHVTTLPVINAWSTILAFCWLLIRSLS